MAAFTYVISRICLTLIEALQFAMLIRAILSWFPLSDDNKIEAFLFGVTEPLIYPIRVLFEKFDSMRNIPIDIPFFVTYLILTVLSVMLSVNG